MGNQQMAYSSNQQPPSVEDPNEWYDSVSDVEEHKEQINAPENNLVVNGILDEFIDSLFESKLANSPSKAITGKNLPEDQQHNINQTRPNTYDEVALNWKGVDIPPEPDCPDRHLANNFHVPPSTSDRTVREESSANEKMLCKENEPSFALRQTTNENTDCLKDPCLRSDSMTPLPCPEDCEVFRDSTINENVKAFELTPKDVQSINHSGKLCEAFCDPKAIDTLQVPLETMDKCSKDNCDEDIPQDSEGIEELSTSTIIRAGEEILEKTATYLELIASNREHKEESATERLITSDDAYALGDQERNVRLASRQKTIPKLDEQCDRQEDKLVKPNALEHLQLHLPEELAIPSKNIGSCQEIPLDVISFNQTLDEIISSSSSFNSEHSQTRKTPDKNQKPVITKESECDSILTKQEDTVSISDLSYIIQAGGLDVISNYNMKNASITSVIDIGQDNITSNGGSQQNECSITELHIISEDQEANPHSVKIHDPINNCKTNPHSVETHDPINNFKTNPQSVDIHDPTNNCKTNPHSVEIHDPINNCKINPHSVETHDTIINCKTNPHPVETHDTIINCKTNPHPVETHDPINNCKTNPHSVEIHDTIINCKTNPHPVETHDPINNCKTNPHSVKIHDPISNLNSSVHDNMTIISSDIPTDVYSSNVVEESFQNFVKESFLSKSPVGILSDKAEAEKPAKVARCDNTNNIPSISELSNASVPILVKLPSCNSEQPFVPKDPITLVKLLEDTENSLAKQTEFLHQNTETKSTEISDSIIENPIASVPNEIPPNNMRKDVTNSIVDTPFISPIDILSAETESSVGEKHTVVEACENIVIPASEYPTSSRNMKYHLTNEIPPNNMEEDVIINTIHTPLRSIDILSPETEPPVSEKHFEVKACKISINPAVEFSSASLIWVDENSTSHNNDSTSAISPKDCDTFIAPLEVAKLEKDASMLSQNEDRKFSSQIGDSSSVAENASRSAPDNPNDVPSVNVNKATSKNTKCNPRRSSIGVLSVKRKSFSSEAEKHIEIKQSDVVNCISSKDEASNVCSPLPEKENRPPSHCNPAVLPVIADTICNPIEGKGKSRSSGKEQSESRQHKEWRRKSNDICSEMGKLENISTSKEHVKEPESFVGAGILPETKQYRNLYEEGNICDLDEVINQFRHKLNPDNVESCSKLDKSKEQLDKFNTKRPPSDIRRNYGKNVERSNLQTTGGYKRETRAPDFKNRNVEDIPFCLDRQECKSSAILSQNDTREQISENVLPKEDLVNFRGIIAGEDIRPENQDGPKNDVAKEKERMTDISNNSSANVDKKERMPELKPETLKSLIADLSLNKSTADVGCNTVEDWTKKDNFKAEADWLKERKKLIGRITDLHQTQNATKFIVKELIYLVTSWMEGKDKDNVDLQETRQKLINERDQALEDLRSVEESFYELHRRYEKTKKLIEDYKKNEDILKRQIGDSEEKLQQQKQMFDHLVKHSEDKIKQANCEILNMGKSKESEMAVLTAQLRKAEMKANSIEKALEQKVRENTELSSICEDLITKCGRK